MSLSTSTLAATVAVVGVALLWLNEKRRERLPPGPSSLPYFGNPLIDRSGICLDSLNEWTRKYGEVVHVNALGSHMIILNTYEAAHDLFVLRGRLYSERPKLYMAQEVVGYKDSIVLGDNTHRLTFMRKAVQTELSPKNLPRFEFIQMAETGLLLGKLLDKPEDFAEHVRIAVAYTIFNITFGYRPKSENDELLLMKKKTMEDFFLTTGPGNFLVDIFPPLKYLPAWFPGAAFKKFGKAAAGRIDAVCRYPYDRIKARKDREGDSGVSLVSTFMQVPDMSPEKEHMLHWASEAAHAAGTDTTVSGALMFILAMVHNPEVQARAHAEIDAWRGFAELRLPTFEDRANLSYIDKVLWEVLRWYPIFPLGLAHRVAQGDVYKGHHIPKDSIMFPNIWNILHDEHMYPDPWKFNPERICAGMHLADATLWLLISNILTVYEIEPIKGLDGKPNLPPLEFTKGLMIQPMPFKCFFKPRSAKAEVLIRSSYVTAQSRTDEF